MATNLSTIPPLLVETALVGQSHAGVIFVDEETIPSDDVGALVRAILALWDQCRALDWTDRGLYLRSAR